MIGHEHILNALAAQGIAVERLQNDSRHVVPGDIFLAHPGVVADGRKFIGAALARGAVAVLWDPADFNWDPRWTVPNAAVTGLRQMAGALADVVYGKPSDRLSLIGVTGTNGKTSCTQWMAAALVAAGRRCAVIGTLGNGFPGALNGSDNTTPDPLQLQRALADYAGQGARACAMEVSSIGLDQGRCNGARFDIAVLTNLSRDHLDYHQTMAAYAEAKHRLFRWPGLRVAIANLDDPFGAAVLADTTATLRVGYSRQANLPESCADWVLRAENERYSVAGTHFTLRDPDDRVEIETALVGSYNVANLLAVAATLRVTGMPLADLPKQLAALRPPAGRMERVDVPDAPLVVIDYAHSPDALSAALGALRPQTTARGGQLFCVFGCGGERDHGKRPMMGAVAQQLADRVWLTSDNPRGESPEAILDEILGGFKSAGRQPAIDVDRPSAIAAALAAASAADVVLIAGKGHEPYQEIAGIRHAYSDRATVMRVLAANAPSEVTS